MDTFIELSKILLPAALVLYAMYLAIKTIIAKELTAKQLDMRQRSIEVALPIRLQAYERITLFLERITPNNLIVRLNQSGISAKEFQQILLKEIRDEYNHNVSQQVYMSEEVWDLVKTAKEDLITDINAASDGLKEAASSLDLAKRLFENLMTKNIDPVDHAIRELKKEIHITF